MLGIATMHTTLPILIRAIFMSISMIRKERVANGILSTLLPWSWNQILILARLYELRDCGRNQCRKHPRAHDEQRPRNHPHEILSRFLKFAGVPLCRNELESRNHEKKNDDGQCYHYKDLKRARDE